MGSQNVMPQYSSVMITAWLKLTPSVLKATVMIPSTTPTPEGVGETITKRYAMANPPHDRPG